MRVGIVTPVLTRVAKSHAKWEVDAGIEDVARIATAADALGYDYLTCSEHVGIPTDVVDATEHLLRMADDWAPRPVDLGFAGERKFLFSAGVGIDASARQLSAAAS